MGKRRVGIVGYGALGKFLYNKLTTDDSVKNDYEIAFVWNRSIERLGDLDESIVCRDLEDFPKFSADIIVEVCHPKVSVEWGPKFLKYADFYCGSPTAFANPACDSAFRKVVEENKASGKAYGLYIPAGALWGGNDIQKMGTLGSLHSLTIIMKKHPASLKLEGELQEKVEKLLRDAEEYSSGSSLQVAQGSTNNPSLYEVEHVLYSGPVRKVATLAPNNVNTMAAAAIAASNLGFDGVTCQLIADFRLNAHVISIDAKGKPLPDGNCLRVFAERTNPAAPGAVTGTATFNSFFSSLKEARGRGAGTFLC